MKEAKTSSVSRAIVVATAVFIAIGITVSITDAVSAQQATQPSSPAPGTSEYYTQVVEPILDDNCYSCHQESQSGGLRLDSYQSILKGGGRGPAIVPGDPNTSIMIKAIRR